MKLEEDATIKMVIIFFDWNLSLMTNGYFASVKQWSKMIRKIIGEKR